MALEELDLIAFSDEQELWSSGALEELVAVASDELDVDVIEELDSSDALDELDFCSRVF